MSIAQKVEQAVDEKEFQIAARGADMVGGEINLSEIPILALGVGKSLRLGKT